MLSSYITDMKNNVNTNSNFGGSALVSGAYDAYTKIAKSESIHLILMTNRANDKLILALYDVCAMNENS